MALSTELISQFAKITNDNEKINENNGTTVFGTAVEYNGAIYVQLDGSELLTPISTTTDIEPGDRVTVWLENHTATVDGNVTSPSVGTNAVKKEVGNQISEFEIIVAEKVSVEEFDAQKARIETLQTDNVTVKQTLAAQNAEIDTLQSDNVTVNQKLAAHSADIEDLTANKLDADIANIKYAKVKDLEATDATIYNLEATYGEFKDITTDKLKAIDGYVRDLDTNKLSAKEADLKYANIDFSNIGDAAIETLFADSGLIKNLVISEGTITGELVGVTIKGDLIEGNTIVADKLVVKGEDGLYYKLNTDGVSMEAQQTEYNSLNGSIIMAKSVTATKINVDDLVAFDATIGGFKITENSIYSGVKNSVNNTTRGVYLDNTGQIAFGDSNSYLKYYKDTDGLYKLAISAGKITIGSSAKDIETTISELKDEITTLVQIESSKGNVFKNDMIATVLTVTIYRGTTIIKNIETLRTVMGTNAYLQWYEQRINDDSSTAISNSDSRIGNNNFSLTLNPGDVNTKSTFRCELIT